MNVQRIGWSFDGIILIILINYANVLLIKNKGQGVKTYYKRIFIISDALNNGFISGCRRFIGVDGWHLKTSFSDILLTAITLNANNDIFWLAFCICDVEYKDSWKWFLDLLKEHLGNWWSFSQVCAIRHCAKHIYVNFMKDLRECFGRLWEQQTEWNLKRKLKNLRKRLHNGWCIMN